MKIGVISDTHVPVVADVLPEEIVERFDGVDMILHAGDLVSLDIIKQLESIAPTIAVRGNMDYSDVRSALPVKTVVDAERFKIGLIHGGGAPWDIVERVKNEFEGVDAIVFGHTHQVLNEVVGGILFFNPGTPTDTRFSARRTIGFLEAGKDLKGRIVDV